MKTNLKAFLLAASFTLLPMLAFGQGALGLGVVGKIYVSSVRGTAECATLASLADTTNGGLIGEEGRITVLRKGMPSVKLGPPGIAVGVMVRLVALTTEETVVALMYQHSVLAAAE